MERLDHLSEIATYWSDVRLAHDGTTEAARAAKERLLDRYEAAIRRYLGAALRDEDAVNEVYQTFALRLARGDFRNADPGRGRFRQMLKTTLYRLVVDHRRLRSRRLQALTGDVPEPSDQIKLFEALDEMLTSNWKNELIERAWKELESYQGRSGHPYHTLLMFRSQHPEVRSEEMAKIFSVKFGREVTASWIRKQLYKARDRLNDYLLCDAARTLERPTAEGLEELLLDLGLHAFCRKALERWRQGTVPRT